MIQAVCDSVCCDTTATHLFGVTVYGIPEWSVFAIAGLAILGVFAIIFATLR